MMIPDGADTVPPASSYDLGQKIKAALAAGAFWFSALLVVGWALLVLATLADNRPPWELWLYVPGVAFVIAVLITWWLGVKWACLAAERAWIVDDVERARRHKMEDEERQRQEAAASKARDDVMTGDDEDGIPETLTLGQRLDLVALAMLERAYLDGGSPTREAMTEAGVCSQEEWNLVNRLVKAVGLRHKKSWLQTFFAEAWAVWREEVRVEEGYVWVLRDSGEWKALERVG